MERRAKIYKIDDKVICIDDGGISVCYVVCGKEKAAVIDTLNGLENLKEIVREITDLPLIVINTHGHIDHVWGNCFFDKAYIHQDDVEVHNQSYEAKKNITKEMAAPFGANDEMLEWFRNCGPCPLEFIRVGDVIELGGIELEVISLRGHTKGSVGLLDKKSGMFFSGDAINTGLWMQLDESSSLREMQQTLKNLEPYRQFIKELRTGHNVNAVSPELIDDIIACVDDLYENGSANDVQWDWIKGKCPVHQFGQAHVWYSPERL